MALGEVALLHQDIAQAILKKERTLRGAEIRFLRKHCGWSQEELASRLGVTEVTVSRWERGATPIGSANQVALRYLFTAPATSPPPPVHRTTACECLYAQDPGVHIHQAGNCLTWNSRAYHSRKKTPLPQPWSRLPSMRRKASRKVCAEGRRPMPPALRSQGSSPGPSTRIQSPSQSGLRFSSTRLTRRVGPRSPGPPLREGPAGKSLFARPA